MPEVVNENGNLPFLFSFSDNFQDKRVPTNGIPATVPEQESDLLLVLITKGMLFCGTTCHLLRRRGVKHRSHRLHYENLFIHKL